MIDVLNLNLITRFSVTGNVTIKLLSKHLIKCALSNAAALVSVDGSPPNVKVVASATEITNSQPHSFVAVHILLANLW